MVWILVLAHLLECVVVRMVRARLQVGVGGRSCMVLLALLIVIVLTIVAILSSGWVRIVAIVRCGDGWDTRPAGIGPKQSGVEASMRDRAYDGSVGAIGIIMRCPVTVTVARPTTQSDQLLTLILKVDRGLSELLPHRLQGGNGESSIARS